MKKIAPIINNVSFVSVTDLIPEEWSSWFWSLLSQGDMTWGDTDHTLISAERFLLCFNEVIDECEEPFDWQDEIFIRETVTQLQKDGIFIDLES